MDIKAFIANPGIIGNPAITDSTPPPPPRHVARGIAAAWLHRLAACFLPPSHLDSPYAASQLCCPAVPGLWLWLVALFAPVQAMVHNIGAAAMHCLLALCLALGATWANAQTDQDSPSVDILIGSTGHPLRFSDFGLTEAVLSIGSQPARGSLRRYLGGNLNVIVLGTTIEGGNVDTLFSDHLGDADSDNRLEYVPGADAISVATGYDSFVFHYTVDGNNNITSTMTINLVGASTQMAASGAPTVAAAMGHTAYNVGVPLTASITGVTELNGINVETLAWKWQQADAPASGAPMASAYSDIAGATATGATSSDFTPLVAHAGKYIRVCAAFMDQFSTPAASGDLCSTGSQVTNAPFFGDASVDDQVWITGTAITDLVLPEAMFGTGAIGYSLSPTLPTGITFTDATRTLSGTPSAAKTAATYTLTATDNAMNTDTLTFSIEAAANAVPAFAANTAIADQTWITGTAITDLVLPAATGGNGTLTHTLTPTTLPAGISFDADTRTLSGTPTAASDEATYTWTVTDADNNTASSDAASLTFSITVTGAPVAEDATYRADRTEGSNTVTIPASVFTGAYTDPDNDSLASVTITEFNSSHGTLMIGEGTAATAVTTTGTSPNNVLAITGGEFDDGPLTFTITAEDLQSTTLMFTLSDGAVDSAAATLTITFGKDIEATTVTEVVAVFNAAATAAAVDAIMGAMSATANDLSLDGTSLAGAARTLGRGGIADTDGRAAWFHGTTARWEYTAAWNAGDNSADSLRHRLQSMAAGDIAMSWQADGSGTRFWARYHSADLSGNEGETLEYDGSGTGFYLGADRRISERMRLGLAISSDSADMTIDIDEDGTDDEASRSATTIYPYLHIDMGGNNQARIIAGIGSGDLDIKSTANSETVSTGLSWNMLAASIRHHRPMRGKLSARFDGSLQLGNSSTDAATFANGSTLAAADASINELAVNAELRYRNNNFTPYASLTGRKLGGDLSQSLAMDLGLGADLQTGAAILRLGVTRQLNDTDHKRDSLSLDIATRPNRSGITASLGSRYDSLSGRPQWQSRLGWQYRNFQSSLQASPDDWRLQARVRW